MLRSSVAGSARRAAADLVDLLQPGKKLSGFSLLRWKEVPELELTALHLRHDKTGAEHLHVARDDSNNVFSIGFRTNPPDNTGVPHILEHTTLCGSEKYPIRDPFFKMLPRTLSNFMNAFTASDHTFYPFATTNAQDFKNLMSVYLDATLHPLLKESDFRQEGWRVGPANPQALVDGASGATAADRKLAFKGVVYNEMKGQMSDAGYYFYIRFQDHIFPAINNSGGDPQEMTNLEYEQLKAFHDMNYHPSNAKLFTYGDMPLVDHLDQIDKRLSQFNLRGISQDIRRPISLERGPVDVSVEGPVDPLVDPSKQFKTSLSWMVGETSDVVESFSLALISALLTDGYSSPLYRGLIDTGLGTDWSPNTGYDGSGAVGIFSIGLTGVKEADVPKLEGQVRQILEKVGDTGFAQAKIDGYLHQLELALKHKTAGFGMSLLQRLKPKWFTGVDPFDSLRWNDTVAEFQARLAEGNYLEGLISKYLLNDRVFRFTMRPSEAFTDDLAKEEEARLATKIKEVVRQAGGEEAAHKRLEEQELELLKEQGKTTTEDLSCLPTVHVRDIPRQKEAIVLRDASESGVQVQWREAPTNGLTYFRAIHTLENLPDELRALIPLFTDAVMRLGTKDMTTEQLEDLIKLKTGGISVGYQSASLPSDFRASQEGLIFSGMALDRNVSVMFDLLRQVIMETNFDGPEAAQQIRQLLQASADGVVNDIASSGHSFARRSAEAALTVGGQRQEQVSGLSQVKLITSLAGRPEADQLQDVIAKLKRIQQVASARGILRAAVTCDVASASENSAQLSKFFSSLSSEVVAFPKQTGKALARNIKTFFPLPYQVYYGALALPGVSYTSRDGASLQILSQLLTHKHLHHEIREKGGAYGGGAYYRPLDGVFGFYSYRDPNPLNTLSIMQNAGQWAVDKRWTDRDLEEAKISVFQGVDAPQSVNEEGISRFLYGISEEMRQARRERLLDVTADQVRAVAQEYLVDGLAHDAGRIAFIGEKPAWVDSTWKVAEMKEVAQAAAVMQDV